jgi:DNA invertase Pin-like site-specific DNA recombinase
MEQLMTKTIAYMRVSTSKQDVENQELELLRYASAQGIAIDTWFKIEMSSRKSMKDRRIDELLDGLSEGDTLIVSELSRLGRSLSQIVAIVDRLIEKGVTFISVKQGMSLNGKHDITSKTTMTLFALMAEIERDLISERTKMGVARAKASGKLVGRPKASRSSKLDEQFPTIKAMVEQGVSKTSIAKLLGVTPQAMHYFVKTRIAA